MAFPNTVKVNFGGGELSPQMQSRADLEIYRTGLQVLENFFITQTAGVRKREGWETVIEEIDIDELNVEDARLVPMLRPEGQFSLLIFGWATIGDNDRNVVCFSEADVATVIENRLGPLHFLTSTTLPPPPVPDGIRCEAGNGFIRLHWRRVPVATDYDYRYKLATDDTWTEINTAGDIGLETTVLIGNDGTPLATALTNDAEYEFAVRSRNSDTESPWSDPPITCAPTQVAPDPPDDLEVTAPPECGLRVTWDEVPGATEYQVQMRSTASPVEDWNESHQFMWQTGRVRRVHNVLNNARYEFQVRSRNAEISSWSRSEYGTPVCGQPPAIPQDVEVEVRGVNAVLLSWDRVEAAAYYVWQTWPYTSTRPDYPRTGTVENAVQDRITVSIENLGSQAMHYFRVFSAYRFEEERLVSISGPSETISIVALPAVPANLRVDQIDAQRTIEWDVSYGARGYRLQAQWRSAILTWEGTSTLYRGTNTSYVHYDDSRGLLGLLDFRYRVFAWNDRGRSEWTDWVNDPLGQVQDPSNG